jgi:hypothetical protein
MKIISFGHMAGDDPGAPPRTLMKLKSGYSGLGPSQMGPRSWIKMPQAQARVDAAMKEKFLGIYPKYKTREEAEDAVARDMNDQGVGIMSGDEAPSGSIMQVPITTAAEVGTAIAPALTFMLLFAGVAIGIRPPKTSR